MLFVRRVPSAVFWAVERAMVAIGKEGNAGSLPGVCEDKKRCKENASEKQVNRREERDSNRWPAPAGYPVSQISQSDFDGDDGGFADVEASVAFSSVTFAMGELRAPMPVARTTTQRRVKESAKDEKARVLLAPRWSWCQSGAVASGQDGQLEQTSGGERCFCVREKGFREETRGVEKMAWDPLVLPCVPAALTALVDAQRGHCHASVQQSFMLSRLAAAAALHSLERPPLSRASSTPGPPSVTAGACLGPLSGDTREAAEAQAGHSAGAKWWENAAWWPASREEVDGRTGGRVGLSLSHEDDVAAGVAWRRSSSRRLRWSPVDTGKHYDHHNDNVCSSPPEIESRGTRLRWAVDVAEVSAVGRLCTRFPKFHRRMLPQVDVDLRLPWIEDRTLNMSSTAAVVDSGVSLVHPSACPSHESPGGGKAALSCLGLGSPSGWPAGEDDTLAGYLSVPLTRTERRLADDHDGDPCPRDWWYRAAVGVDAGRPGHQSPSARALWTPSAAPSHPSLFCDDDLPAFLRALILTQHWSLRECCVKLVGQAQRSFSYASLYTAENVYPSSTSDPRPPWGGGCHDYWSSSSSLDRLFASPLPLPQGLLQPFRVYHTRCHDDHGDADAAAMRDAGLSPRAIVCVSWIEWLPRLHRQPETSTRASAGAAGAAAFGDSHPRVVAEVQSGRLEEGHCKGAWEDGRVQWHPHVVTLAAAAESSTE